MKRASDSILTVVNICEEVVEGGERIQGEYLRKQNLRENKKLCHLHKGRAAIVVKERHYIVKQMKRTGPKEREHT